MTPCTNMTLFSNHNSTKMQQQQQEENKSGAATSGAVPVDASSHTTTNSKSPDDKDLEKGLTPAPVSVEGEQNSSSCRRRGGSGKLFASPSSAGSSSSLKVGQPQPSHHHWSDSTKSSASRSNHNGFSKWLLTALIVLLGAISAGGFLRFGYHATNSDMEGRFGSTAEAIANHIHSSFQTYEMFASWIHESCHRSETRNDAIDPYDNIAGHLGYCSRTEFRRLYEYIASQGVDFLAAQLLRNITHDVRDAVEQEARNFYETNYPAVNYRGMTGQIFTEDGISVEPREEAPYYMPIHYVEPVVGNEIVLELDKLNTTSAFSAIEAVRTYTPILSPRLRLVQEKADAYGVILASPGVQTSIENVTRTHSIAQIVIRIPSFLEYALRSSNDDRKHVYLFDSTEGAGTEDEGPAFLGAVHVQVDHSSALQANGAHELEFLLLPEISLSEIPRPEGSRYFERHLYVGGRVWTMAVTSTDHQVDMVFVILGATIIFAASLFCAAWFHSHLSRIGKLSRLKAQAQAEKAKAASMQARRERELNEFIGT